MTYSAASGPSLVFGKLNAGPRVWMYSEASAASTAIDGAGYITDAYQRGMRANDLLLYVNLATGIWTAHTVVTCTAAAGADLSDATTLSGNTAGD